MSRESSVTGLLSLSDRFYGALLGAQVAQDLGRNLSAETEHFCAMLRRYEPFVAKASQPSSQPCLPLSAEGWTERVLHQQLSGVRRVVAATTLAALPGPMDPTLELVWQTFCQDLPWEISFKLMDLAAARPRQKAVLGLWLGAAQGPRAIPLGRLSPQVIEGARSRSRQIFLTWSGCDEGQEVGVS